jgi:peptidoglycan/xylan/chitin deacetylase (PgdA/CDA1 family)
MAYSERHLSMGDRRGRAVWPKNCRMAVLLYIAAEEYQWEFTEEVPEMLSRGDKPPSLSPISALKYGFEFGIPRLLDVLERNNLKISFFMNGLAAKRHPELAKKIAGQGHEIVAHAFSQETHMGRLPRQKQRENIRRTLKTLEKFTGERPVGWDSPYASCSRDTIEVLIEEGFGYHADLQDDELPYFIDYKGKTFVEVPLQRVYAINDYAIFTRDAKMTPDQIAESVNAIFDIYYREAESRPLMWRFGVHPYLGGKPECAYVVDQVLRHLRGHDDVWLPTFAETADWWTKKFGKV